ncbi:MAG TPA: type IV pilin-like G/H family protein [Coleofasciculaceae cyanobacterium]
MPNRNIILIQPILDIAAMTQPSDFENESTPPQSKKSLPVILWVVAGLGCGCFGLILLGIIAAIALPSFLTSANKARQAEAKNNVGAMVRGQQAYQLEKGNFSQSIQDLGIVIQPETENYRYQIVPQSDKKSVMVTAQAKRETLKSYTGAVFIIKKDEKARTIAGICESDSPTTTPPTMPNVVSNGTNSVECPPGSRSLGNMQ